MLKNQAITSQAGYLIKVLLGLAPLALEVLVALGLPELTLSTTARQAVIVVLVLTMLMQVQLIRWLYGVPTRNGNFCTLRFLGI